MVYKSFSINLLENQRALLEKGSVGFYPEQMIENGAFLLVNGEDVSLFEEKSKGIYFGHYFFRSQGRDALVSAKEILNFAFNDVVKTVIGMTPTENKKALWFTRQLGFTMMDVVSSELGDLQISMLTKENFK